MQSSNLLISFVSLDNKRSVEVKIAKVCDFTGGGGFDEPFVSAQSGEEVGTWQSLIGFYCKEVEKEYEYLLKTEDCEFCWRSKNRPVIEEQTVR